MPVVPKRSPVPSVETAPLPGIRVPANVPRQAFTPPKVPDVSGVQQQVGALYQQARAKANEIAVLDANNQLTQLRTRILRDPERGILSAKGKNAADAAQSWDEQWTKGISDIRLGLSNDEQRMAFDRMAANDHARATEQIETHVAAQLHAYEQATVSSALDLVYDDAIQNAGDPKAVQAAIDKGVAIATDWARRQGMPEEERKATIGALVSKAHAGVIEALATRKEDLAASEYLKAHASELTAKDLIESQRVTGSASVMGESQRHADQIMRGNPSFGDAMSQAGQIAEPGVRSATEQRIRQAFADKDAVERKQRDDAFDEATNIVRQTGDFDNVPWRLRKQLTPAMESSIRALAEHIRHPKKQTDMGLYATLMNMAGLNPQTRQDFERLDLTEFRPQLDDSDFERLVSLQLQQRNATNAAVQRGDIDEPPPRQSDRSFAVPVPVRVRTDQRLSIPPQWLEAAKTSPRYRAYLEHMGVLQPAGDQGGDIDLTNPGNP